jgi:hypothetical protein
MMAMQDEEYECPGCGEPIEADSKTCPNCGCELEWADDEFDDES